MEVIRYGDLSATENNSADCGMNGSLVSSILLLKLLLPVRTRINTLRNYHLEYTKVFLLEEVLFSLKNNKFYLFGGDMIAPSKNNHTLTNENGKNNENDYFKTNHKPESQKSKL